MAALNFNYRLVVETFSNVALQNNEEFEALLCINNCPVDFGRLTIKFLCWFGLDSLKSLVSFLQIGYDDYEDSESKVETEDAT